MSDAVWTADETLPKAELHVHLEGTITPRLARELAHRNAKAIPSALVDGETAYRWSSASQFFEAYDAAASCLASAGDYAEIAFRYLSGLADEGAIYAELTVSPSHAASVGVTWQEHLDGVADGVRRAKAATGIEARLIVTALRHEPPEHALGIARRLYEDPHPLVTGFGLAGDEQANPLSGFTAAFELADRRVWAARFMPARSSGPRASARPSTYRSAAWVTASAPSRTTRSSRNWSDRRSCSRSAHRATWRLGSSQPGRTTPCQGFAQPA